MLVKENDDYCKSCFKKGKSRDKYRRFSKRDADVTMNFGDVNTDLSRFLPGTQQRTRPTIMELQDAQKLVLSYMNEVADRFQKVPGSAMLIRYVRSSYQNDPVRSAIELILVLFFVRYLLAPSYSTHRQNFVTLSEEVSGSFKSGEGDG